MYSWVLFIKLKCNPFCPCADKKLVTLLESIKGRLKFIPHILQPSVHLLRRSFLLLKSEGNKEQPGYPKNSSKPFIVWFIPWQHPCKELLRNPNVANFSQYLTNNAAFRTNYESFRVNIRPKVINQDHCLQLRLISKQLCDTYCKHWSSCCSYPFQS